MKKLKIILLFSLIIYIYIITSNNIYRKDLQLDNVILEGIIKDITIKDDKVSIILKSNQKILVNYYNESNFNLGDKVSVSGELLYPSDNTWFNLFNYRKYLLSNKISYVLKADNI